MAPAVAAHAAAQFARCALLLLRFCFSLQHCALKPRGLRVPLVFASVWHFLSFSFLLHVC